MTQENETPIKNKSQSAANAGAGTAVDAKTGLAKPEKSQTAETDQAKKMGTTGNAVGSANDLSQEVIELVTELRDTVKRLDPRKHTLKTLRRSLSNVSDILKDIEALYPESK